MEPLQERIMTPEKRALLRNNREKAIREKMSASKQKREEREALIIAANKSLANSSQKIVVNKRRFGNEIASEYWYLTIPDTGNWKPTSYNRERQIKEFFRKFIYKYFVPDFLIFNPEKSINRNDPDDIRKQYLVSVVSGKSFSKAHRSDFTKAEAHFFLNDRVSKTWVEATWRARLLASGLNKQYVNFFVRAILDKVANVKDPTFIDFVHFLGRHEYKWTKNEIEDVMDYIRSLTWRHNEMAEEFSFAGRTVKSVIDLSNEWHARIQKEKSSGCTWDGLPLNNGTYEKPDGLWEVSQILNSKRLIEEGRKMHHCVASYEAGCKVGSIGIFSIRRMDHITHELYRESTFEVSCDGRIKQHRAACNREPSNGAKDTVKRWAAENGVKTGEL
jgi:hypothetical protein